MTQLHATKNGCEILLSHPFILNMVETRGIEPLTSCMPCKRSPS